MNNRIESIMKRQALTLIIGGHNLDNLSEVEQVAMYDGIIASGKLEYLGEEIQLPGDLIDSPEDAAFHLLDEAYHAIKNSILEATKGYLVTGQVGHQDANPTTIIADDSIQAKELWKQEMLECNADVDEDDMYVCEAVELNNYLAH